MTTERNHEVLRRYRRIAMWIGAVGVGAASSLVAWGYLQSFTLQFLSIAAAGALVGALIGYLFFEIIIVHLIGPMPVGSGRSAKGGGEGVDFDAD